MNNSRKVFYKILIATSSACAITTCLLMPTSCGATVPLKMTSEQINQFANALKNPLPQTAAYQPMINWMNGSNAENKHKLLLLGYDGTRVDAAARLSEDSAIFSNAYNGHPYFAHCGGAKRGNQKTSSNPGWCSVFTGVWGRENGIKNNDSDGVLKKPIIQSTLANRGIETYFGNCEFGWVWNSIMENSTVDYHGKSSDADILIDAKQRISEDYPAVFCIFDDVDHNGHRTGFDPDNSQYMDALKETDAKAKELISTVESRDNEDWMIVMTTDHGGNGKRGHGGNSDGEFYTWFSCNKNIFA